MYEQKDIYTKIYVRYIYNIPYSTFGYLMPYTVCRMGEWVLLRLSGLSVCVYVHLNRTKMVYFLFMNIVENSLEDFTF